MGLGTGKFVVFFFFKIYFRERERAQVPTCGREGRGKESHAGYLQIMEPDAGLDPRIPRP